MKVFDIAVGISNASDKKDTTFASIVFSTGTSILPKWINENIETRNSEFVLPLARFILNDYICTEGYRSLCTYY